MASHMVFDQKMNPAFCDNPEAVKRWLSQRIRKNPEALRYSVRIWKDGTFVFLSASEYLKASGS